MNLYFKKTAIDDIQGAEAYIRDKLHNASAAKKLTETIFDTALLLRDSPYLGEALNGKYDVDSDLRFLIAAKHLIFYRVLEDRIEVTRVLDGRQDYMAILF